jgi:hypothetical protein
MIESLKTIVKCKNCINTFVLTFIAIIFRTLQIILFICRIELLQMKCAIQSKAGTRHKGR